MTRIRIGSAIKQAIQTTVGNMKQRQSGLHVPADYIAGKHFGGFEGYEDWIQDCIRLSCQMARGVGPEELPKLTSLCLYVRTKESNEIAGPLIQPHAVILRALDAYAENPPPAHLLGVDMSEGEHEKGYDLSKDAREQFERVEAQRELGSLMVIAARWMVNRKDGFVELRTSVSAWRPSSIEEAKAVPKQEYKYSM